LRPYARGARLADADRLAILAGRAPKGGVETGPILCSCFAIGRSTLLRAIRGDKLVSVEAIEGAARRRELRLVHPRAQGSARASRGGSAGALTHPSS
jgi:hypothetical protein